MTFEKERTTGGGEGSGPKLRGKGFEKVEGGKQKASRRLPYWDMHTEMDVPVILLNKVRNI